MKNFGIVHIMVALVWMFLSGNLTTGGFLVALVGTYFLLVVFRKAIGCESYVRRVRAFFVFVFGLLWEIVLSNVRIMLVALSREAPKIRGEFINYDVRGLTDFEILLISYCIGLSPGTVAADLSDDKETLILHIFATDRDEACEIIDRTLKNSILKFTRND